MGSVRVIVPNVKIGKLSELAERELVATATGERLSLARSLSDFSSLGSLLVHYETLLPGRRASSAHLHSVKEEIFLVLEGTPSVWVDGELRQLGSGDFVGFSAGERRAHMLLNRSDKPAVVLTIGTNPPGDEITYVSTEDASL